MYDIFYVSKTNILPRRWELFLQNYPTAQKVENISCFDQIKVKAFTKMFWLIWDDIQINNEFDLLSYRVSKWDESYVHCFLHEETGYANGIVLFPKNYKISDKEFADRYYINKKEIDIIASRDRVKKYDCFILQSYDQYLTAVEKSEQEMFWGQWPEIEIIDESIFKIYFDVRSGMYEHDLNENHVFLNEMNGKQSYVNGLVLFSVKSIIGKKEFDRRYLVSKKEHNRLVSKHKPYDVFFISYDELNADENYQRLLSICPRSKRIHKVKGIHQAHIEAAKQSTTDMFWVVDGDAFIVDDFDFNFVYFINSYEVDCVHVWTSINPINDLQYGNGGVKLLPKNLTLAVDKTSHDMTTSISKKFKKMDVISNENRFNTDEFNTWKSAFRECAKLAAKIIPGQVDTETEYRLNVWQTIGIEKPYGRYAVAGAKAGALFGKNNIDSLHMINDFDWLKEIYENKFKKNI